MKTPNLSPSPVLIALTLLSSATLSTASGQAINETHKLLAGDGQTNDEFGRTLAVSGSTAISGCWQDDSAAASNSGSAYLYDTNTGSQLAHLVASDGSRGDQFGCSVGISGNTAIIGAYYDDDLGFQSGSAYLFDVTTYTEIAKLLPADGSASDVFGYSVAISGTTAIVGAPYDDDNGGSGSAYLFDTTTGAQIAKLLPSDGAADDNFGFSVAISGNIAVVGAVFADPTDSNSGCAYVFDATTGQELLKLLPDDGAINDEFGVSVAVSGSTAIVGSFHDDDHGSNSGAAYLFDTTSGIQIAKLVADDATSEDRFGRSVGIIGSTAIIGAHRDDENGMEAGSAYLFDTTTGSQISKLLPSDPDLGDRFGRAVAISGDTALVGALRDDDNGMDSGSAYVYGVPSPTVTTYCFGDGSGTPCPCGNTGGPGEGCANSTGSGATLSISGSSSISADDLVLSTTGLPVGPGLYFQGQNAINSGDGIVFGDGLRCAGMDVTRLQVRWSNGGEAETSISIATKGGNSAGLTRRYQHWYRDPHGSPCGALFNLSNGYELTWTP